jgi:hypothetical protein
METIRILRLKNGEDIITYIEEIDKFNFILREPMVVLVKFDNRTGRQTILIDNWLPKTVIRNNEALITESEILTMMEPTAEFSEYFETAIGSLNKESSDGHLSDEMDIEANKHLMSMMLDTVGPDISVSH